MASRVEATGGASGATAARPEPRLADAWRRYLPGGGWRYDVAVDGLKANMTDIQAVIGRAQLRHFDAYQARRAEVADRYDGALAAIAGIRRPLRPTAGRHAWHLYAVRVPSVVDELAAEGVMPGNKKHAYVLRKVIRSLIEEVWLQSEGFVNIEDALQPFINGSKAQSNAARALSEEEIALRRILSKVESTRTKNPDMTLGDLHATFGIKPSLLSLM